MWLGCITASAGVAVADSTTGSAPQAPQPVESQQIRRTNLTLCCFHIAAEAAQRMAVISAQAVA